MNKETVEQKMMRMAVLSRQAYAQMSIQERQDQTVAALEAAIVKPAVSVHPVARQWDAFADILKGMRDTVGEPS